MAQLITVTQIVEYNPVYNNSFGKVEKINCETVDLIINVNNIESIFSYKNEKHWPDANSVIELKKVNTSQDIVEHDKKNSIFYIEEIFTIESPEEIMKMANK